MPSISELEARRAEEIAEFNKAGPLEQMPDLTNEQIQAVQGTRKDSRAPWETYSESLDEVLSPELEAAIEEFASHDPHGSTDSQTQEELCRVKEENDNAAREYQWLSPDEYKEEGARIGSIMHSTELIKKLTEQCGVVARYRNHPQPKRVTLLVDTSNGTQPMEVACWVQLGYMPEFSICNFDDHGVILQEAYRGWRTVLLQMFMKQMLTVETATRIFGEARGPAAGKYLQITQSLRTSGLQQG